jgi:hypothetical protein
LTTVGTIIIVTNETETVRRNKIASLVCIVFGSERSEREIINYRNAEDDVQYLVSRLHKKLVEKVVEPARAVFAWG